MHEELGCSVEQYNSLVSKVGAKAIFAFLTEYEKYTNKLRLMYYIDDAGTFLGRNRPRDHIAKTIYDNLPASDKKDIFNYLAILEDCEEDE